MYDTIQTWLDICCFNLSTSVNAAETYCIEMDITFDSVKMILTLNLIPYVIGGYKSLGNIS